MTTVLRDCIETIREGWKTSGHPVVVVATTTDVDKVPTGVVGLFKEEIGIEVRPTCCATRSSSCAVPDGLLPPLAGPGRARATRHLAQPHLGRPPRARRLASCTRRPDRRPRRQRPRRPRSTSTSRRRRASSRPSLPLDLGSSTSLILLIGLLSSTVIGTDTRRPHPRRRRPHLARLQLRARQGPSGLQREHRRAQDPQRDVGRRRRPRERQERHPRHDPAAARAARAVPRRAQEAQRCVGADVPFGRVSPP